MKGGRVHHRLQEYEPWLCVPRMIDDRGGTNIVRTVAVGLASRGGLDSTAQWCEVETRLGFPWPFFWSWTHLTNYIPRPSTQTQTIHLSRVYASMRKERLSVFTEGRIGWAARVYRHDVRAGAAGADGRRGEMQQDRLSRPLCPLSRHQVGTRPVTSWRVRLSARWKSPLMLFRIPTACSRMSQGGPP